jgi:hypothetical protein
VKRKLIRLESPVATRDFADDNKKTATPILQMGIRGLGFEKFADEVSGEFCRWENFVV